MVNDAKLSKQNKTDKTYCAGDDSQHHDTFIINFIEYILNDSIDIVIS